MSGPGYGPVGGHRSAQDVVFSPQQEAAITKIIVERMGNLSGGGPGSATCADDRAHQRHSRQQTPQQARGLDLRIDRRLRPRYLHGVVDAGLREDPRREGT